RPHGVSAQLHTGVQPHPRASVVDRDRGAGVEGARSRWSAGRAGHTAVLAVLRGRDQWWRTARLWSTRTTSCGQKTSNGSTTFGSPWSCPQGRDDAPYRGEEPDGGLATPCFVPMLPAETYPAISCGGYFGSRSTTGLNSRTVRTGTLRQVRQS